MRFLYAAISYPDVAVNTNMYTALVQELTTLGHEVRVIAPTVDTSSHVAIEGGVPVLRVRSGSLFKTNLFVKGVNNLLLNSRYKKAVQKFWPDWVVDWIITSTPPITLAGLINGLKIRHRARLYLILRDIFPQNARDLGMIRNPFVFSYFRRRERELYGISDIIGCMSPGNIEFLRRQDPQVASAGKLTYFPNWIRPRSGELEGKATDGFRKKFQMEGKFIALFGGNFGKPQKMEFLLDLARRAQHLPDVVFCLIGDGTEREKIRNLVKRENLSNIVMLKRMPQSEYQALISEADIGLVNLSDKFTIPNIPSRTLGYWDASLPVLAATDLHTDLDESMLKKYNAGLWAQTGKIDDYFAQFMRLYQNPELRKALGQNGRKAVETDFSVRTAAGRLLEQIKNTEPPSSSR
jgi:glycosyltransferase involved in cell wall biosynthesis